ncbi:hypothetical protein EVAR_96955_1 [Eumeta japonica]|uniref:Uncharacterized protein n=1 Tax=Eumeta variegata TaxID=151549 RepID=A0A4C1VF96_EUMVA|nr:hypothetical protein EVAR_96955_1 [Eumeta japonica]
MILDAMNTVSINTCFYIYRQTSGVHIRHLTGRREGPPAVDIIIRRRAGLRRKGVKASVQPRRAVNRLGTLRDCSLNTARLHSGP